MNRVNATALMALSVALAAPRATRAATTDIILTVSTCEAAGVPTERLFELARAELSPRAVTADESARDLQAARLSVQLCQGSANGVTLEWQDSGAPVVVRQLDLSDVVGELRMRTLAVAMAELVASAPANAQTVNGGQNEPQPQVATSTIASSQPPQQPPIEAESQVRQQPQATPPIEQSEQPALARVDLARSAYANPVAPALRASAGAALREFFNPRTTLVGPWLSLSSRRISGEMQLLTTSQPVPASTLNTVTLYDAGLAGIYRAMSWGSTIVTSANMRVELGSTWVRGETRDAPNVRKLPTKAGPHVGGALDFAAETSLLGNIGVQLHLLVGGEAWGVSAQAFNRAVASTNGLFAGAELGVHYGRD